ncbi:MAG: peptidoglycan-binding protein [Gammaproteobacteria bacterium]|nr:peptidoglycan-binding protein [Gammaproteobacteria bacterium]
MITLRLGVADRGRIPKSAEAFFGELHESKMREKSCPGGRKFRDEKNDLWRDFTANGGSEVAALQEKLAASGFLPHGGASGVFDYRTQSAVRLFQEYVRSVEEPKYVIGTPDALAGNRTKEHLDRWQSDGRQVSWKGAPGADTPWFRLLNAFRDRTAANPGPLHQVVMKRWKGTEQPDTLPVSEWDFSKKHIHLIGIRRGAKEDWKNRLNNDVFVLLAGGGVFTFFGSTDPNPNTSTPPFLLPGQHLYRFGWHKLTRKRLPKSGLGPWKMYRAFRPKSAGVLVMRDSENRRSKVNLKDERVLAAAVDKNLNTTINIHWSGRHTSNWSAGCQVISGGGYINHRNKLVDCWDHAAASYVNLPQKTRGAYNVLLDLITVLSPRPTVTDGDTLRYTLINERDLDLEPSLGSDFVVNALRRGLDILKNHGHSNYRKYLTQIEANSANP